VDNEQENALPELPYFYLLLALHSLSVQIRREIVNCPLKISFFSPSFLLYPSVLLSSLTLLSEFYKIFNNNSCNFSFCNKCTHTDERDEEKSGECVRIEPKKTEVKECP
jgi:hypothetical protein